MMAAIGPLLYDIWSINSSVNLIIWAQVSSAFVYEKRTLISAWRCKWVRSKVNRPISDFTNKDPNLNPNSTNTECIVSIQIQYQLKRTQSRYKIRCGVHW